MLSNLKKIGCTAILLVLSTATAIGCSSAKAQAVTVQTETVQKRSIESTISISGVLLAQNSVTISSKAMAEVKTINFQVGDTVEKGDTLIVLDTTQLKAQLSQAKAALNQAKLQATAAQSSAEGASAAIATLQSQADLAQINYNNAQASYDAVVAAHDVGTATDADVQQAYTVLQVAQAQYNTAAASVAQASASASSATNTANTLAAAVQVAEANINIINVQIKACTIKSPIDGIVASRNFNPGELATTGAQLMTIIEQGSVKLKGTVSQGVLPLLAAGQSVSVGVDIYPDRTYTGTISLIAPMAVTTGEYFPIEITVAATKELKPGMSARADIPVQSESHMSVPANAVATESGQSFVYVIENGLAKKINVVAGVSNGTYTEILSGLSEGQEVITSQVSVLKDGMSVTKQ